MLKGIKEVQQLAGRIDPWMFCVALLASLAAAIIASGLYARFYERRGTGSQVHRSFPLLAISITTLFIAVQMSLPLSLGLLGALSIIRFRTPIKEPEEVGFIMLVIAASITCATFHFQFLVILYAVAAVTLFAMRGRGILRNDRGDGIIIISVNKDQAGRGLTAIEACVRDVTQHSTLESSTSSDDRVSLQFAFTGLTCDIETLRGRVGEATETSDINIYFNRPAPLK